MASHSRIVMSMYTLLRNQPEPTVEEIEDAFQGMGLVQGPGGEGAKRVSEEGRAGAEWKPGGTRSSRHLREGLRLPHHGS